MTRAFCQRCRAYRNLAKLALAPAPEYAGHPRNGNDGSVSDWRCSDSADCEAKLNGVPKFDEETRKAKAREVSRRASEKWRRAHPERARETQRSHRARNVEKRRESGRRYEAANIEKRREKNRLYYRKNRERCLEKDREYVAANPQKVRTRHRRYRSLNSEKIAESQRRYAAMSGRDKRARRRAALAGAPRIEKIDRAEIYARDGGLCGICGEHVPRESFTLDHITPLSKGGEHTYANLTVAHNSCNSAKRDGRKPTQRPLFARIPAIGLRS